ncbi:MAG: UvrB/UvrC motif-containing protein [Phycisphaerae bacterium]
MLCQRCKKQSATVHLTEIINAEKREKHLCEKCAAEEGVTMKQHIPLNELLTSFLVAQAGAQEIANLTCPECGMTFVEYRNQGLLGCPNDYDAFEKALTPLIQHAHEGGTHHVGKVPRHRAGTAGRQTELLRLRRELNAAVQREDYERAAELRDRIQTLESQ